MTPTTLPEPVPHGLSVLELGLYRHLADHVSSEAELITSYRELAEAPATPEAARYLLRLVVEDEERHHRVMHEIATALGEGIVWKNDAETVPDLPHGKPDPALEEVTKRFYLTKIKRGRCPPGCRWLASSSLPPGDALTSLGAGRRGRGRR